MEIIILGTIVFLASYVSAWFLVPWVKKKITPALGYRMLHAFGFDADE
ncbi:MAG: hypothetical protein KGH99_00995 [Thaumarchaeota archaeon]|nr:hypothetical protein [Candidatus Nitrosotalea sp.]MDE1872036.1 hypothetical protein [Nitrososphaerota archaeon]